MQVIPPVVEKPFCEVTQVVATLTESDNISLALLEIRRTDVLHFIGSESDRS